MSWHKYIDATLAEASAQENPRGLLLPESLRVVLAGVEDRSTSNVNTLHVVRAMAECAVHPMVADLGKMQADGPASRLRGIGDWWHSRDTLTNTTTHNTLSRIAMYYSPYGGDGLQPYMLGSALHAASDLMRYAYPIDYRKPDNPEAKPLAGDMLGVVTLFAITSSVHLALCGPGRNQAAIDDLCAL